MSVSLPIAIFNIPDILIQLSDLPLQQLYISFALLQLLFQIAIFLSQDIILLFGRVRPLNIKLRGLLPFMRGFKVTWFGKRVRLNMFLLVLFSSELFIKSGSIFIVGAFDGG